MYTKENSKFLKHLDFVILDCVVLELSFWIAYCIKNGFGNPFENQLYTEIFLLVIALDIAIMFVCNTLKNVLKRGYLKELKSTLWQSLVLILYISVFLFMTKRGSDFSRQIVLSGVIIYTVITYSARILWKKIVIKRLRNGAKNALILVTTTKLAPGLLSDIKKYDLGSHTVVGLILPDDEDTEEIDGVKVVGKFSNLIDFILKNWVDEVLVSTEHGKRLPMDIIMDLESMGVTVHRKLDDSDISAVKHTVDHMCGMLVLTSAINYATPRQVFVKRLMDIAGGIAGCIITGILYLILAPKIKKESPGPVFFTQQRVGRNGKIFKIYKFRSMYMDAEERKKELMAQNKHNDDYMFKLDFDPRIIGNKIDENGNQITGIGQKIRDWSLDEFPQFLNVLKGEMSLVGTRPPLLSEVEMYKAHHRARLGVTPGITGLWQISGRSNIDDFDEVVKLDTQYIQNWSLSLDIKILFKTVMVVLKRDGSM